MLAFVIFLFLLDHSYLHRCLPSGSFLQCYWNGHLHANQVSSDLLIPRSQTWLPLSPLFECCGGGFEFCYAQAMLSVTHSLLLPADQDAELSAPSPAPCLPGCCHASSLMIMDWTSEPVSQPLLVIFPYKGCLGHGVSSQQWKPSLTHTHTHMYSLWETVLIGSISSVVFKFLRI